jgi:hypothetical protein
MAVMKRRQDEALRKAQSANQETQTPPIQGGEVPTPPRDE